MSTLHKAGRELSQCRGRLRSNTRAVRNHVQEITPESSATLTLGLLQGCPSLGKNSPIGNGHRRTSETHLCG